MVKRKNSKKFVGKLQFVFGVLLIVASVFFAIYFHSDYKQSIFSQDTRFVGEVEYISNLDNFDSIEMRAIRAVGISNNYSIDRNYFTLKFIILESLFAVVFILSLLFITQGLINMLEVNK